MNTTITVHIDRDSVHAGDDIDSHAVALSVPSSTKIGEFLRLVRDTGFLPSIAGGEATWLVEHADSRPAYVAVLAQQSLDPKVTLAAGTTVADLAPTGAPRLHFRYWCQADPDVVFDCVRSGSPLPDKYR
jgi:hypothetical protein